MRTIRNWVSGKRKHDRDAKVSHAALLAAPIRVTRRLHVEPIEPRVLLSADPLETKYTDDISAALTQVENLLDNLEGHDLFADPLPMVVGTEASSGAGAIADISDIFHQNLVDPLDNIAAAIANSEDGDLSNLQTDWKAFFEKSGYYNADDSSLTIDHSEVDGKDVYKVVMSQAIDRDFTIGADDPVHDYNVSLDTKGHMNLTFDIGFTLTVDQSAASESSAVTFSLNSLSLNSTVDQDLTGHTLTLGIVPFKVAGTANDSSDGGIKYSVTLNVVDGDKLDNKSTSELSSISNLTNYVTVSAANNGTATTVLASLPLTLEGPAAGISGISAGSSPDITLTGEVVDLGAEVNVSMNTELQLLSNFDAKDFLAIMNNFVSAVDSIDQGDTLDASLPFTDGLTIGEAVDLAAKMENIIAQLSSEVGVLGFDEHQSATASDANSSVDLVSDVIDLGEHPFPESGLTFVLTLDGQDINLNIDKVDTTPNEDGGEQPIDSLDDLVTAISAALATTTAKDRVSVSQQNGKLVFTASKNSDNKPVKIEIGSLAGKTSFTNIVEFSQQAGELLGFTGSAEQMIDALNLRFVNGSLAMDIAYADSQTYSGDVNFNAGSATGALDSLTGSGDISVKSVLGVSATLLIDMHALGNDVDWSISTPKLSELFGGNGVVTTNTANTTGQDGVEDLQITMRDGTQYAVDVDENWTVDELVSHLNGLDSDLHVSFDKDTFRITIEDASSSTSGNAGAVGLHLGENAFTDTTDSNPSAVLTGVIADNADFGAATSFILKVGKFSPVIVNIAADSGRTTAQDFANAVNAALQSIDVPEDILGVASKHYSDIVHVSAGTSDGKAVLEVATTITNVISTDTKKISERNLINSSLRMEAVDLTVTSINGSLVGFNLGIEGSNKANLSESVGRITSIALHGDTYSQHLGLQDLNAAVHIDMSITNLDATGRVGLIDFTANGTGSVSLNAVVSVHNSFTDSKSSEVRAITAHDIINSDSSAAVSDVHFSSGNGEQPYAQLTLSNVDVAGDVLDNLTVGNISITMDQLDSISDLKNLTPTVDLGGLDNENVSALTDLDVNSIVAALQNALQYISGKYAGSDLAADLPLLGMSATGLLDFAADIQSKLLAFKNNPSSGLGDLEAALKTAFGMDVNSSAIDVHLNQDQSALMIDINYSPTSLSSKQSLNLAIGDLADQANDQGVKDLLGGLENIVDVNGTGLVDVTAAATVGLTLGFRLSQPENSTPASGSTAIGNLNGGQGIGTNTSNKTDLSIKLANGESFEVDLDALITSGATVSDIVAGIQQAATTAGIDSSELTIGIDENGSLVFTDLTTADTTSIPSGLDDLGLDNAASGSVISGTFGDGFNPKAAFDFAISVNGAASVTVHLDADENRTASDFEAALQSALGKAFMATANVNGIANSVPDYASLGSLITVSVSGQNLSLSADTDLLGGSATLQVSDVASTSAEPGLVVKSINGSTAAEDLGIASASTNIVDGVLTGGKLYADSNNDRFFIDTQNSKVHFDLSVSANDLNFNTNFGAATGKITGGSVALGSLAGSAVAGQSGFGVSGPATFDLTLNDEYNGSANDDRLYFNEISTNNIADIANVASNVAVKADLPLSIGGVNFNPGVGVQASDYFGDGKVVKVTSADLGDSLDAGSILNNPGLLLNGLDYFLSQLEGQIENRLLELDLPFIGDALGVTAEYFQDLHQGLIDSITESIQDFQDDNPGVLVPTNTVVEHALEAVLKQIGAVDGADHNKDVDVIAVYDQDLDEVRFSADIHWDFYDQDVNLSQDLGIAGLGLDVSSGKVNLELGMDFDFDFGVNASQGFFVETGAIDELVVTFNLDFSDLNAKGQQGILNSEITNNGSAFSGTVTFDINPDQGSVSANDIVENNRSHDGRLTFSEVRTVNHLFASTIDASGHLDFHLRTLATDSALGAGLPELSHDLHVGFDFDHQKFGDGTAADIDYDTLEYLNVSINLAKIITDTLLPIFETIDSMLDPIRPLIEFLTSPIPGISQILGSLSILDMARSVGAVNDNAFNFINTLDNIIDLIAQVKAFKTGAASSISFANYGSYSYDGDTVLKNPNGVGSINLLDEIDYDHYAFANIDSLKTEMGISGGLLDDLTKETWINVFSLPVLSDTKLALKFLTGQTDNVELFHFDLPKFDVDFEWEKSKEYPLYPPYLNLEVGIGASLKITFDLAGGYDLHGLVEFIESGDPISVFDGFYISDLHQGSKDIPEIVLVGEIFGSASVKINAGIVSASGGLKLALGTQINFDINDPNGDGKLRPSEFLGLMSISPEYLFDIHGELYVRVAAIGDVTLHLLFTNKTLFEIDKTLFKATLFSWDLNPPNEPVLANLDNGTLTINMGTHAGDRLVQNTEDGDETFYIKHVGGTAGDETIEVRSTLFNNVVQTFSHVKSVAAFGGAGNDQIILSGIASNMVLDGGAGNDVIRLDGNGISGGTMSTGNAVIRAGKGDDTVYGGSGNDSIFGDVGNDTIYAGAGNDYVEAGSGNDIIHGGTGDDIIYGGSGNDDIFGEDGNDTLFGERGLDLIIGGLGDDKLYGGDGSDIMFGDKATVSDDRLTLEASSSEGGNDTLYGDGGADYMFGGAGADLVTGGDGNDIMFGDTGTITFADNGMLIEANTNVAASVGGNDTLLGGDNEDIIFGGIGDDIIDGGNHNDVLLGDTGLVQGAAGATMSGQYLVKGDNRASGKDNIKGGSGNDILIGGLGSDKLYGEVGRDVVGGDSISLLRSQPNTILDVISVETVDEGQGSSDIIDGGSGTDMLLGGGGTGIAEGTNVSGDVITGGTGSDIILGDYGKIEPSTGLGATVTGRDGSNSGNDLINADSGYDIVIGGGGNDTIDGGDGNDTLLGDIGTVSRDKVARILRAETTNENIGGNDIINGRADNDVIIGGTGADTLTGEDGIDVILGDLGYVTTANGTDADIVARNAANGGNDTIFGNAGNDFLIGGGGNDTINGGEGNNYVAGDNAAVTRSVYTVAEGSDDPLTELAADPVLKFETLEEALGGNDIIETGAGNDVILGGVGNDSITAGDGNDIILGDLGIVIPMGSVGPDVIARNGSLGTTNRDIISAGDGNKVVLGGSGDDTITIGTGATNGAGFTNYISGDLAELKRDVDGNLISFETVDETFGGNDTITTGASTGNDFILGGTGDDTISSHNGNDTILGDLGKILRVGVAGLEVTARNGDIVLSGTTNKDTITADDGNKIVLGGSGGDSITIGTGATSGAGFTNYISGDLAELKQDANGNLVSFETVEESIGGNDTITTGASTGNDFILGGTGDDTISSHNGNDTILGDLGKILRVGSAGLEVTARNGDIVLSGTTNKDTITADDGNKIVLGGSGGDSITIGTGATSGAGFTNYISGDLAELKQDANGNLVSFETVEENVGGNDTITTGASTGDDFILGGIGADTIDTSNGTDIILGDLGIIIPVGNAGPDVIARNGNIGLVNDDTIRAADGNKVVLGGSGDDTITIGTGATNGAGFTNYISGDLAELKRDANGNLISFETVEESIGGNDTITTGASTGNDFILGGTGDDTISSHNGNDTILGDLGKILRVGSAGLEVTARNGDIILNGTTNKDTITADDGNKIVLGGSGGDTITIGTGSTSGAGFTNYISGDLAELKQDADGNLISFETVEETISGDDTITTGAGAGTDFILGGIGKDKITSGNGDDTILGDLGIIVPKGSDGADVKGRNGNLDTAADDEINAGNGNNVVIGGSGADTITTGSGADYISGDLAELTRKADGTLVLFETVEESIGGADTISAGAGNDVIFGGQAGDTIFAGADNDVILGDAGYLKLDDSPIFVIAEKKDWDLGTHFTLETRNQAVGGDDSIFGNAGNDIIIGGSFDDYMEGNDGNDAIIGDQGGATYRDTTDRLEIHTKELLAENNGNDTLFGNAGNDELLGGAFEDDLFGGANDDILIGDEGEVYYGFVPREPGKEYHDSLPRMARSTESFTGRHDTLDSGSGVDFILGGEQPNFIVADKKLDLVQIENGEFRIDEKRNSKTEFPAFQGDPILQPQAAYFAKDVPSTDPSVLRNNEPSSTTQSSGSGFGGVTQGSTGASQTINLNARGTFDTAMIPQVMIPQRTSSVVDNTIAEFIEGATLLEPVRHASDGQAGG
ncbi:LEPR-XLL domain-containing protein, partial [Thalassospira sp. TSL5-1]|uniref:calcium-binding protein n=1 Tax=Thalassospira sp. TSL5-1 TaxID=1544451 RepID=UPI00095CF4DD